MIDFSTFTTTKEEMDLISKLAIKAQRECLSQWNILNIAMDIEVAHNDIPLRLGELLDAEGFDFFHDICGIARYLDRKTGKLTDCFVPRFAQ